MTYDRADTALLLVDPYNDFLSAGGKMWPAVEAVATEVGLLENLKALVAVARSAGVPIFYVPHRRWRPGDFENWDHPNPYQLQSAGMQVFAEGSWGGDWHPDFVPQDGDIIAAEHWGSSGFANTKITRVIVVGLLANTCIETTAKFAVELGYHVTLVRDATAAFSADRMHAAHELNGPTFAHAIVTTEALLEALPMGT